PSPDIRLRVTRRGGVQPAITLRRNGRIAACGKCSILLWLDPTRSGVDAGCVRGLCGNPAPPEYRNFSCDGAGCSTVPSATPSSLGCWPLTPQPGPVACAESYRGR